MSHSNTTQFVQNLLMSQSVAVVNCLIGVTVQFCNQYLQRDVPFQLLFVFYLFLIVTFWYKPAQSKSSNMQWLQILVFSVFDFGSSAAVVCAYRYTSVAAVILTTSLAGPFSMLFGALFMKTMFSLPQIMCSFASVACTVLFALLDFQSAPNRLLGSVLAGLGAVGYGLNTVLNEVLIKRGVTAAVILPRLGCFGAVFSAIPVVVWERQFTGTVLAVAVVYAALMVGFYYLQMSVIARRGAVFLNMAVLQTNFYSVAASWGIFGQKFQFIQVFPAIGIVVGVALFSQ